MISAQDALVMTGRPLQLPPQASARMRFLTNSPCSARRGMKIRHQHTSLSPTSNIQGSRPTILPDSLQQYNVVLRLVYICGGTISPPVAVAIACGSHALRTSGTRQTCPPSHLSARQHSGRGIPRSLWSEGTHIALPKTTPHCHVLPVVRRHSGLRLCTR